MIRPGEEWGSPTADLPDVEVHGSDADLADAVVRHPRALVRFHPDDASDLARATGLGLPSAHGFAVPLDALRVGFNGRGDVPGAPVPVPHGGALLAVNMAVIGTPPDALGRGVRRFGANVRIDGRSAFHGPCTTVVVATGQFLRGLDVVPRGHPGDGRAEVQVYAVPGRQQRALRARLATGTHVPHPAITQRSGTRIRVDLDRRVPLELDGRRGPRTDLVEIEAVANAYRLLL